MAELNGQTVVIISGKKQTLNEFARTLADLGVSTAIYLVGSTAPGFAIDENGDKIEFGEEFENSPAKSNYIVWY